jgi:hypothetical protein
MIVSNRRHMLGFSHFGVVKGTKFGCAVITAPEGLFKGCSTLFQAFDSDCWVDAKSGRLVAKAMLHPSLSKRQRAEIHDAFLTHLDVLGNADRDLATAIDEVFAVAKEKGFVVDSVNQAHTLAQGRDPNLPDASHNALTQEITGESAAFAELAKRIFESASLSADPIIEDLKKKLGEESKEFKNKFVPVRFEFLYFFIHLANRSAFAQLGAEKSEKLSSQLVEHLIDTTVEILMGHWPEHLKQGIKKDSYNNYNVAESDYAKCKAIFLMPEDDTKTEDRIATGEKSKSMIGQLVDNVSEIITGKVNISLLFPLQILESIGGMLEKKKILMR